MSSSRRRSSSRGPYSRRARPGLSLTLAGLAAAKVAGLCAFASGFLLTRVELRDASACDDFPHAAADDADAASPAPGFPGCWSRAPVNKAVVLVIDGARFDFAGPARAVGNPPAAGSGTRGADGPSTSASPPPPPPMSVFGDLLARDGPSFGDLFRFVADPPTTTQQRLKGLLTGGLPTFADVGDSFGGGAALREDNVVHIAAARMGLRIAFSGDDTWLDLFPDPRASFRAGCEPFPSFDVKDLDLVDEGVRRHLNATLAEPERWDVLIGHFLGVDHAGHAHGVRSEAMRRKLAENDADVRRVVASMERSDAYDDAMLLVFGDHGMTLAGDHGGGTPEETDAFLFAYHPRAAARRRRKRSARDARGGGGGGGDGGAPRRAELEGAPFARGPPTYEATRLFPQINFAPTVSAVLGLPAPFGNLGRIDRRAWDVAWAGWRDAEERGGEDGGEEAAKTVAEKTTVDAADGSYAAATRAVAAQVRRYLRRYAAAAGTTLLTEAEEEAIFDGGADEGVPPGGAGVRSKRGEPIEGSFEGEEPFGGSSDGSSGTSSSPRDRLRAHEAFLDAAANAARARWTRFDLPRMLAGLALVLAGLLAQLLAVRAIERDDDDDDDSKKPSASDRGAIFASAASLEALVHATLTLGLFACRLSNSYVVAEGDAAHFVVASLAFARGAFAIAGRERASAVFGAVVALATNAALQALGAAWGKEEEAAAAGGFSTGAASPGSSSPSASSFAFACARRVSLAALPWMARAALRGYPREGGAAACSRRTRVCVAIALAGVGCRAFLAPGAPAHAALERFCFILRAFPSPFEWFGGEGAASSEGAAPASDPRFWAPLRWARVHALALPRVTYAASALALASATLESEQTRRRAARAAKKGPPPGPFFWTAFYRRGGRGGDGDEDGDGGGNSARPTLAAAWAAAPTLAMLAGDGGAVWVALATTHVAALVASRRRRAANRFDGTLAPSGPFGLACATYAASSALFHAGGRRCAFDGLRFARAFVGFERFRFWTMGALLATDTWAGDALLCASLPAMADATVTTVSSGGGSSEGDDAVGEDGGEEEEEGGGGLGRRTAVDVKRDRRVASATLTLSLLRGVGAFASAAFAGHARRHLMVWAIFAPKFAFEACGLVLVECMLLRATRG